MRVCLYVCIHIQTFICTHVSIYIYTHTYIHTYVYIQTQLHVIYKKPAENLNRVEVIGMTLPVSRGLWIYKSCVNVCIRM